MMLCCYAVDALSGFYVILSGSVTTSNLHLRSLLSKDSVPDAATPMQEDENFKSSKVKLCTSLLSIQVIIYLFIIYLLYHRTRGTT